MGSKYCKNNIFSMYNSFFSKPRTSQDLNSFENVEKHLDNKSRRRKGLRGISKWVSSALCNSNKKFKMNVFSFPSGPIFTSPFASPVASIRFKRKKRNLSFNIFSLWATNSKSFGHSFFASTVKMFGNLIRLKKCSLIC